MKRLLIIMFVVSLFVPIVANAAGTYPINYRNVSNPQSLTDLLRNRIGGIEDDLKLLPATGSMGTGQVFYVDSSVGSDTYTGKTLATATATLDAAVALCTADRGDVIYVMQGHTENLSGANGVDVDISGVTVIGLGSGDLRPTFTYTNAAGEFVIGADDVTVQNIVFNASVTAVLKAIDIEAGAENAKIIGCTFGVDLPGTDEFNNAIIIGDASHKPIIASNLFYQEDGGAVSAIYADLDANDLIITGNVIYGDYSTACIVSDTTKSDNILIADNVLVNGILGGTAGLNTEPVIELLATTSGVIMNNVIACNVATPDVAIVAADCWLFGNTYTETEGGVSVPPMWLTTDTALNIIGFNDADNQYSSSTVAANADGSIIERLEQIDVDTSLMIPVMEFSIKKSITSIATPDQVLYTVAGGPIKIVEIIGIVTGVIQSQSTLINYNVAVTTPAGDVVFGTDGTALEINGDAAGTLYTWSGVVAADLVETTAGVALGLASGATTGLVVPPGNIELRSTAASTGTIDFYMRYIPLGPGVTVTAP